MLFHTDDPTAKPACEVGRGELVVYEEWLDEHVNAPPMQDLLFE